MKRVLLLEDQNLTRKALSKLLQNSFPGLVVMAAGDEQEARRMLEECVQQENGLDAAILDLKVPAEEKTNPEVSSFCVTIQKMFPNAVLGHITAYLNDDDVNAHVNKYHLNREELLVVTDFFIDKQCTDWAEQVVSKLAGAGIVRWLATLPDEGKTPGRVLRQASHRHQSGTFHRAARIREIKQNWKLLKPELQERLRKFFTVDVEKDGTVRVR